MFRQPSSTVAAVDAGTTLNDLPDEILLHIGAQFTGLSREIDLVNLALVSPRWRMVAQEWLVKEPRFNITYIYEYMCELSRRPKLIQRVKSMEIWSTSQGRIAYDDEDSPPMLLGYNPVKAPEEMTSAFECMTQCRAIVKRFARNEKDRDMWMRALDEDVIPALFGILICTLPNLKELRLGQGWLMDFPMFSNMLATQVQPIPKTWMYSFLAGPLDLLYSRLTVLEVPADMRTLEFPGTSTVFDLRPFQHLAEVGITMEALLHDYEILGESPDPRKIFPPTIKVLRISEATTFTACFLKDLCAAKISGHFPSLRRVEVYYMDTSNDQIWKGEKLSLLLIKFLRRIFRAAELELYLYFPRWWMLETWEIGGTPLSLQEEGLLPVAELLALRQYPEGSHVRFEPGDLENLVRNYPPLETEWDRDGDAVMT
ncbi:F-box multi-domain protein [Pyrenophora tritici-repentis]|nr:F-box multi-domain protein [Pyrenophora tritici-repentis]KAI0606287.1 F-box multi-domain protein [Pyrenophora tritici-repentis]KAI0618450.1 F-box multi-domain protein [Pyrenophora tritici-repentis]